MNFYNFIIRWRFQIGVLFLLGGVIFNIYGSLGFAWPFYGLALILIITHFLFGPLRIIQSYLEKGNIAGAQQILSIIWFPKLLIKPIRSVYYTLQGHLAMANQDLNKAETMMKKGLDLGLPMNDAQGASMLQMGMIAMQKGKMKESEGYVREAIRKGLPDKETEATAYLQMCSILMTKREFRGAKEYFRKVKKLNPTTPELVTQIKQVERYISRMPG
ncbi:MAG: tetratricopeptide repeat protein [Chitinophagaceae bacterium]